MFEALFVLVVVSIGPAYVIYKYDAGDSDWERDASDFLNKGNQ